MTGIAVFTKVPVPGKSMSRLAASVGAETAAALHLAFLKDTIVTAKAHGAVCLFVTEKHDIFDALCHEHGLSQRVQVEGDLGQKMCAAIEELLRVHSRAIIVGSDAPLLGDVHFHEAKRSEGLAFCPTPDGGFALVSAERVPNFSGVPWSAADTLERTLLLNPSAQFIAPAFDVDTEKDLRRLQNALSDTANHAPYTRATLNDLGFFESPKAETEPVIKVPIQRYIEGREQSVLNEQDPVAVEAPLTIRIQGESFVTTMRTPGDDEALVLGLLLAEGLINSPQDLSRMLACAPGVIDVLPAGGFAFDLDRINRRRGSLMTSSCGVCGREQIKDLIASLDHHRGETPSAPLTSLRALRAELQRRQKLFEHTGATHAAALFHADGSFGTIGEDVGRHNAADKAVGHWIATTSPNIRPGALVVSGRASFEMVQKAARVGAGVLASQKGVTSMAVKSAQCAGITLVGFLSDTRFNIYK